MLGTPLHWIDGPWKGRLALAARPRGGDWLEDEVLAWRASGVGAVLSLLEQQEERELDLVDEREQVTGLGLEFLTLPIPDRAVPTSSAKLEKILATSDGLLTAGKGLVIHCRQGVGRAGLVAACLLINAGVDSQEAVDRLRVSRGVEVPETAQQRLWIDQFAGALAIPR